MQLLTGLCQLSNQSVNYTAQQFLSTFLISKHLLSEKQFQDQTDSLLTMSKSNAPIALNRFLFLLRAVNHGNALVSTYGTNFEYINPWFEQSDGVFYTRAVIYDNNCSCGLNGSCSIPASFNQTSSSQSMIIKGFKMGCTPSESFLASTFECFYDLSCINLIHEMMGYSDIYAPTPLNASISRFSMNTTVADLVNDLFVESWSTMTNYSAYFHQCSPTECSYTYIQKLNSLYTITYILGLFGGLTIVLKWICPKMVYFVAKIYRCRKKRAAQVQPAIIHDIATELQSTSIVSTPR